MSLIGKIKCKLGFHDWVIVSTKFDNIYVQIYACNRCPHTERDDK